MKDKGEKQGRKIQLPGYCHPMTGKSRGGDKNCDHDYPPESKQEDDHDVVWWTCSKCGMQRGYEIYD